MVSCIYTIVCEEKRHRIPAADMVDICPESPSLPRYVEQLLIINDTCLLLMDPLPSPLPPQNIIYKIKRGQTFCGLDTKNASKCQKSQKMPNDRTFKCPVPNSWGT